MLEYRELLTLEWHEFEEIWMNGHFAATESIVGDTTSALAGRVDDAWLTDSLICPTVWTVHLPSGEEFHLAMVQAVEWQIEASVSIYFRDSRSGFQWWGPLSRSASIEGIVCLGGSWNLLEWWIPSSSRTNDMGAGNRSRY